MKDNRSKMSIKAAALKRLVMWHYLNSKLDLVLVSEFPKAGGSWYCQMLSDALDIPFPRNKTPNLESCILHGHHLYHNNFGKIISVMRDGRDIMISAYYHFLFENDKNPPHSIVKHRNNLGFKDYDDIKNNLPAFIDYMFNDFAKGKTHFNWSQAVDSFFYNPNVYVVKYENLLIDPVEELKKSISFLEKPEVCLNDLQSIVEKYSFKNMTKRKQGQENKKSFLRKGIAGDWVNHFNNDSAKLFGMYAGEELIKAGYEENHDWIKNL